MHELHYTSWTYRSSGEAKRGSLSLPTTRFDCTQSHQYGGITHIRINVSCKDASYVFENINTLILYHESKSVGIS